MSRFLDLVTRRPGWVLAALLAPTAAALLGLFDPETGRLRLSVDPSVERLLPGHDDDRRFWAEARRVFGEHQTALVALPTDGVFTAENLARVARITRSLEALPGVRRVVSLANAPRLEPLGGEAARPGGAGSEVGEPDPARRLREDVRANPLYRGVLVSEDERVAAFLVFFQDLGDAELLARDYASRIAAAAAPDEVWVTGAPILQAATARLLLRQLWVVVPGAVAVGALILLLAFGSLWGVLLPVATILLAVVWTLGTLAWAGRPLNLVTVIVPPLIIALGLAYAMHVLSEYDQGEAPQEPGGRAPDEPRAGERDGRAERVRRSLVGVAVPLLVAGLTTAAGLAALALSPLGAVREFALFSLLGLVYTLALCFSLVPAGLCLWGRVRPGRAAPVGGLFSRLATRLAGFDVRHRRAVVVVGVLVLLLGAAGATRIQAGAGYIRDLPADEPARLHHEAIDAAFGGATPLSIVIETNLGDAFTDPEFLSEVEALQDWLEAQPEIGGTTSLVDHLKLLNDAMTGEGLVLPATQKLSKQLLVFGGGEAIEGYADLNFHTTRIALRSHVESAEALDALLERVERRLQRLPPLFQARVTGDAVLLARTVSRIARGQILNLGLALVAIYAILAALFTSLRVGLYALLPNAIPLAFYFGLLGFAGLSLDPSSSLIACIALGIAVDDTIHYMVRFQSEARRRASEEQAAGRALRAVLRPITFTTLLLCAAFLMLVTSDLRNQVQFGALAAFTLAVAWLVDVTLTPALCAGMRIVTFWDVLRVDLGPDPQHSIPLMEGLSRREARTVALVLDIRELSAGEALVRQGESLREVYVVIEGELSVWTGGEGQRVDLYRVSRGDVVGEVGFFAAASPANVVATRDARLLRFEDSDLEYLVARHPRIAARVYRNLNRSQAGLLVAAARRIR